GRSPRRRPRDSPPRRHAARLLQRRRAGAQRLPRRGADRLRRRGRLPRRVRPARRGGRRPMTRDRRWLALLTPVILFAFAARAIDLGAEPLWVDESFSFALADAPLLSGPVALIASDVHPPLYFLLLGFWTRVAGYTE